MLIFFCYFKASTANPAIVSYNASMEKNYNAWRVFTIIIIFSYFKYALACYNTRPNPTTSIYNASVVNFYNATNSLARFES
jgi:hypothetical protein